MGLTTISKRTFIPRGITAMKANGSAILGHTLGVDICTNVSGGAALTDAQQVTTAVDCYYSGTCTGIKWYLATQGNFTGDQFNGFAMYTMAAGVCTQVAITTNDANHWKGTALTYIVTPWTATLTVTAGTIYYVALLYNNSAFVTAPAIGNSSIGWSAAAAVDMTNSVKFNSVWASRTTLATPFNMSSVTQSTLRPIFMLY